jgi:TldD protein
VSDFINRLDDGLKLRVWEKALARGGDFAEIFVEDTDTLAFQLKDGKVADLSQGRRQGVGVRVVAGDVYGYAWLDGFNEKDLLEAATTAAQIAESGKPAVEPVRRLKLQNFYPVEHSTLEVDFQHKMNLMHEADDALRAFDARIIQVGMGYGESMRSIRVATSDGIDVTDIQPLIRIGGFVVAAEGEKRVMGMYAYGGRIGREILTDKPPSKAMLHAAKLAIVNLAAKPIKGGPMPVVLGPGWGGVLLHEAVGHGLEGDFNYKGASLFSGRIGQKVASELVTVVDDATVPYHRGSINIDDEGTPGMRTVLIENGILRGYMHDRISAKQMGLPLTGNGRRETYMKPPIPRMTNTYMLGGTTPLEEIISSTKDGFYAKQLGGGQVDIASGDFVFEVTEGYRIEDGKLTYPVEKATLIGNGPQTLGKVDMVADDFSLCPGVGSCGKDGQAAPVGVGEPSLRVSEVTVGGRG